MTWADVHYFRPSEFDSPGETGSGFKMNLDFVHKLDALRIAVKMPLRINSGYRTPSHNAAIADSVDGSAHTTGHAADIRTPDSTTRHAVLEAAFRMGFRRIGIGTTFVHLDDDLTKPQDVVWTYPPSRTA